jgi:hypothetical protein
MKMPTRSAAALVLCLLLNPAPVVAQQAEVAVERGAHYIGEWTQVQVTARGFEQGAKPVCAAQNIPAGLVWIADPPSSQSMTSTRIINGRVTSSAQVTHIFNFYLLADKPGAYRIPGFTVAHGTTQADTAAITLSIGDVVQSDDMRIEMVLPRQPIYPGQRVPVKLRWWYAGENLDDVRIINLRVPLFDHFEYLDDPVRRGDQSLAVITAQGRVQLKADIQRRTLDGRQWIVLELGRTLICDQPGEIELGAASINVDKVTRWGRDVFGRRKAIEAVRRRAVGGAGKLLAKALPLADAPPSFAGAVGHGFSIDVAADRTVLRAHDPIKLTITLRGDGDLEGASLPKLAGPSAMEPSRFGVPPAETAGTMTDDGKQFVVTVRVLDEAVDEIPPIQYAWFDPTQQSFQTTRSDPIALRVMETRMVTARDVVASKNGSIDPTPTAAPTAQAEPTRPSFDLTAADLAITRDPARLLVDVSQLYGGPRLRWAIYFVALLLLPLALWRRRAAGIDPATMARRKLFKVQITAITQAAKLPQQEAATRIAAALRRIMVHATGHRRAELDELLSQCDALAFARTVETDGSIDPQLCEQASELARAIAGETA